MRDIRPSPIRYFSCRSSRLLAVLFVSTAWLTGCNRDQSQPASWSFDSKTNQSTDSSATPTTPDASTTDIELIKGNETFCQPDRPIQKDGGDNGPYLTDCSTARMVQLLGANHEWKFFFDKESTNLQARFQNRTEAALKSGAFTFDRTVSDYEKNLITTADQASTSQYTSDVLDDSKWQSVTVPHSWNRYGRYCRNDTKFLNVTACSPDFPEENKDKGFGWYRLHFARPVPKGGGRTFIQFDGVASVADVWLNGQYLGRHNGSFGRFRFDVTDIAKDGDNLLAVRADNTQRTTDATGNGAPDRYVENATSYVLPLSGDFTINGGIYRDVSLITTATPIYFDLEDYGGPGLYISGTPVIAQAGSSEADVSVKALVANKSTHEQQISIRIKVSDMDGKLVTTLLSPGDRAKGVTLADEAPAVSVTAPLGTSVNTIGFRLIGIKLWDGRKSPYLYRVTADILDAKGRLIDSITQPLGLRSSAVDKASGFQLNDRPIYLHGVSRHQDRLNQGWQLAKGDYDQDMVLIREMGANTIRFAHYQHGARWYELADTYGMAVWSEIPFVDTSCVSANPITDPRVAYNAQTQLRELIRQNFNHPSVMWWGLSNEIRKIPTCSDADIALVKELQLTAKAEDSTRGTVLASSRGPGDLENITTDIAHNYYPGWYSWLNKSWSDWAEKKLLSLYKAEKGGAPVGLSEYGAGGAVNQHTDARQPIGFDRSVDPPKSWQQSSQWHPIEYQTYLHEYAWATIESFSCGKVGSTNCRLWGSWVWNMFDFASEMRTEGGYIDINDKGLVTFDRKKKKDAFYFYKSAWNTNDKFLYISSRDYTQRSKQQGRLDSGLFTIEVFSNLGNLDKNLKLEIDTAGSDTLQPSCELKTFMVPDGLGNSTTATLKNVCMWPNVALKLGPNHIKVSSRVDGNTYSDEVTWTLLD
ncbi:glycoside hydrolase family 2 protein [Labrys sp. 22185]|uniref:glycoside hydrolase family 2 protein n=1 Tax=Labrys sp. 22185 TaxID=3453888 RepID=UPI003F848B4F